ncbi:MAG: M20/M25/M40 family metallo-hydrolase [Euryarchaeota archaeon]|nr:M20/M25/M40 family metallo-hydrolase [Euryarchaeota archaeon]
MTRKAFLALALALAILGSGMALKAENGAAPKQTSAQPQPIVDTDQEAEIRSIITRINESVVAQHIQALQDYKTRYLETPYSWDSASYIHGAMSRAGLAVDYKEFRSSVPPYTRFRMRNVVGSLPGTATGSTAVFIICAHYDSITNTGTQFTDAPGADDNGSGTAAVLAAAEALSQYRFNHTIRFIAFAGEERGMIGSKNYAMLESAAGTNISGVINLDMVGYNPAPASNLLRVRTNIPSENLANFTNDTAAKYQDLIGLQMNKVVDTTANSDHTSFWPYGYQAVHLIEDRYTSNTNYHKPTDTISNLNLTYAANSTQVAVATIAELAGLNRTDTEPPLCSNRAPAPDGWGSESPAVSFDLRDISGVNVTDMALWVNGSPVVPSLSYVPLGWRVANTAGVFPDGAVISVRVIANDSRGNMLDTSWNFTVDAVPPLPPADVSISLRATTADKRGLVLDVGANGTYNGTYDSHGMLKPSVMLRGEHKMWYTGGDSNDHERILYANSSDGSVWTKYGLVLDLGQVGDDDAEHASYCSVLWSGEYKMWYSGSDGGTWRIMYANSSDGLSWAKQGTVMDIGTNGSSDLYWAYAPTVMLDGSLYRMWYTGWDGVAYRICYAESDNGTYWNKKGVALSIGAPGSLDGQGASEPSVVNDGAQYLMWYSGFDGLRYRVLEASSKDGVNWTRQGICVNIGSAGDYDVTYAMAPGALMVDGYPWIYYSGLFGNFRILRATRNATTQRSNVLVGWNASLSADVPEYRIRLSSNWSAFSAGGGESVSATLGLALADAGDGNATPLYAKVSSIDKVGHATEHWSILGKAGFSFQAGWGLVGDPFSAGAPLNEFLSSVAWDYAMSYAAGEPANPWRTNYTDRLDALNDLSTVGECQGVWVRATANETYATAGKLANHSVTLYAGWNHVAMPYAHGMAASEVMGLIGASCSFIEGFDQAGTYRTKALAPADLMLPGQSYWLYMSSGTTWSAYNY